MKPGEYKHVLAYQELESGALDARGNPVRVFKSRFTVRCKIQSLYGQEIEGSHVRVAQGVFRIEMRYNPRIKPRGRLVGKGKTFEISYVDNVNMDNKVTVITATEVS